MENINSTGGEKDAREKRMQMYRSILNYYRSRSLSLDHILSSKQANDSIPSEIKTKEGFSRAVQGLYDDITLVQSVKQSLELVKNSLSAMELTRSGALQYRKDIVDKIEGIVHFSRFLIKLYESRPTELEIIEKMKTYSRVLEEYGRSLEALKSNQKEEDRQVSEKAEHQVYKINLIRMMKSVLIGYISVNCPGMLKNLDQFRTPTRRNLTVDDFVDNWDIGLPPS